MTRRNTVPAAATIGIAAIALAVTCSIAGNASAAPCEGRPATNAAADIKRPARKPGTLFRARANIVTTFYRAGLSAKVPRSVMNQAVDALGRFIDLQRDFRHGAEFEIMWERRGPKRRGAPLILVFATVERNGNRVSIARFTPTGKRPGYFSINGVDITGLLLRTPVNGARLSSPFGLRRHPILGYTRMHQGVDFAAPIGTRVKAAGEGVVEIAGWRGGYGRYIRIRHNGRYRSAYAHLSRFAPGIRPGQRVAQGQVIGYVGSTGRSTGPHLHYEVLDRNRAVNPAGVPNRPQRQLCGLELKAFQWHLSLLSLRPAISPGESQAAAGE